MSIGCKIIVKPRQVELIKTRRVYILHNPSSFVKVARNMAMQFHIKIAGLFRKEESLVGKLPAFQGTSQFFPQFYCGLECGRR